MEERNLPYTAPQIEEIPQLDETVLGFSEPPPPGS